MAELVVINPDLDRAALAAEFARIGRLQIRDVLTNASAHGLRRILAEQTPWCLAWQAMADGPHLVRQERLAQMSTDELVEIRSKLKAARGEGAYAFLYHSYPLVTAYLERWRPGSLQDRLLEELNGADVLQLIRDVTGVPEIVKLDGQATLYAPGNFLWPHNDQESERGRRVAYVLNLTCDDWKPEWGGYLTFFDSDWNIEWGVRPRFNTLNLFRVPQWHSVSEVTATAPPGGRLAITGWARDR